MTTDFKVNLDIQANAILPEEPVWEGKWALNYILKTGESFFGMLTYASEQEASKMKYHNADGTAWSNEKTHFRYKGTPIDKKDLVAIIPMPIREGWE